MRLGPLGGGASLSWSDSGILCCSCSAPVEADASDLGIQLRIRENLNLSRATAGWTAAARWSQPGQGKSDTAGKQRCCRYVTPQLDCRDVDLSSTTSGRLMKEDHPHHTVLRPYSASRPSSRWRGGTMFHFIDDSIESALEQAVGAANEKLEASQARHPAISPRRARRRVARRRPDPAPWRRATPRPHRWRFLKPPTRRVRHLPLRRRVRHARAG